MSIQLCLLPISTTGVITLARSRNIKPGFFHNEDIVEMDYWVRLLFVGLWTLADREGRLEDRPKKIKMALFPADDVDIDAGISELVRYGFALRYEVENCKYIQIVAFLKHQKPHHQEQKSVIPSPESSHQGTSKHRTNPSDSLNPITDSLNPITDEDSSSLDESAKRIVDHLNTTAGKNFKYSDHTLAPIRARLNSGYGEQDLIFVIDNKSSQWLKTEQEKFLRPETLFGPKKFEGYVNEPKHTKTKSNGIDFDAITNELEQEERGGVVSPNGDNLHRLEASSRG